MNNKLNLLKRYFNNRYSKNDSCELKRMLEMHDSELESLMLMHWDEFQGEKLLKDKDLSEILNQLNVDLLLKSQVSKVRRFYHHFSKIAAILVFPLILALGILYFQFNEYLLQKNVFVEVTSPMGSRTSLNLPDGSTVWLNGNSQIRYPAVFNKKRNVELKGEAFFKVKSDKEHPFLVSVNDLSVRATGTEFNVLAYDDDPEISIMLKAEAFFKVKSDKEHPFLVSVNDLSVRATGTEFNVLAYDDDPEISIMLKEGKVEVSDNQQSVIKTMQTGYVLMYNKKSLDIDYSLINATNYSKWINGKLIFENASLKEVVSRMERWYGVKIVIENEELLQLHFKATFMNESIEEALKLLQFTATFKYRFTKRQVNTDGTFASPQIIISKS